MPDEINTQTLAERVRALRTAKSMSMDSLARAAEISKDAIWRIESGQTSSPYKIDRIAGALGVTPEFLLTGEAAVPASA